LGYFVEGSAREPGEEVIPELAADEAIVFEEFFDVGLWMPPHPALTDILVLFRVQLHQLTPNAFAHFSKYFWAVMSFGGKPNDDGFAKRYELHYQLKKIGADGGDKYQQFNYINFHGRWGSGAKLNAWFYCKVPRHLFERGGKTVHILHSYMCSLEFQTEPPFACADDDSGDVAFVQATKFIGGRDAVEEFIACGMYPLATGTNFDRVATRTTPVSKLKVPLPKFIAIHKDDNEDDVQFLVRVELEAEGIIGSYTKVEHVACLVDMRNGGRLNHVFGLAAVTCEPHPVPGTDEFTKAVRKRKLDATGNNPSKWLKAVGKKKMEAAKVLLHGGRLVRSDCLQRWWLQLGH
jgi:hypothetical protein